MAGLEPTGFVAKTTEEILEEIRADQRADIDVTLDQSEESLLGNLNASMSTQLSQLWELGRIVYDARRPSAASFASLDSLSAFTGTARLAATRGLVTLSVQLGAGKTLPLGSVAHVTGQNSNRWRTTATVTNSSGVTAFVSVAAEAEVPGVFIANAGTITVIATPVNGWLAVTNPEDAAEGHEIETDVQLRIRREVELSRPGTSPVPAIAADLSDVEVDGVKVVRSVFVEENTSAYYDDLRRAPHTVEAIVQFTPGLAGEDLDNARQALAEQLWRSKAGGIDTHGDHSAVVVDSNSQSHTLRWTEPEEIEIWVDVLLKVDDATFAGTDAVIAAILAYGDTLALGADVLRAKIICALIDVPGVLDVTEVKLGKSATSKRPENVVIGPRELAVFDSSRIS